MFCETLNFLDDRKRMDMSINVFSGPCTTSHVSPLGFLPLLIHNLPSAGVRLLDVAATAWQQHARAEHWASPIHRPSQGLGWLRGSCYLVAPSQSRARTPTTDTCVLCVRHAERHVMRDGNQPHPQAEQESKQVQQRSSHPITQTRTHG